MSIRSTATPSRLRRASFTIAVSLIATSVVFAQQGPPPGRGNAPPIKLTNLQVFPKDIAPAALIQQMRQFTVDLGVRCTFCHEENEQTHRPDFASDAKPQKLTARVMLRMTENINTSYLATLPTGAAKASCYTCHRGHSEPEAEPPAPAPGARPDGAAAPPPPPQ